MGRDHSHSHAGAGPGNEKRLAGALVLTAAFLVAEVVGGVLTNSLALLSDAAHMFTDVTALAIALAAMRIGRRPVDDRRSYGYARFEILAAAVNAVMLFGAALYILYEAWSRFRSPPEIHSWGMFVIATVGLVVNFIALKLLAGGRDESLNVKGAYLEVWSDLLGSIGVMVAAVAIYFTEWRWLDPLVAVAIGFWVLPRAWKLFRETMHILLEGTPPDVDVGALSKAILETAGVKDLHDLHVWTLTSRRHVLTAHVVIPADADRQAVLGSLSSMLREKFELAHTTLQIEDEAGALAHGPMHGRAPTTAEHGDHSHHQGESR